MADRTVTVRLRADVSQFERNIRNAARNTNVLAGAGAAASALLVAGFAAAVSAAAKFDKSLSNVKAVSGASRKEMDQLRSAALQAGKDTSFTASQAADAEAELARAGVSVANITGGALKGSLALAASGQLDLSESATIAAQAMNTFNLKGKDVGHIADVLSAGANKSAADVHGLGEALRQGGLLAQQTGLSLEDTVGILSAFADHALIGSDAGTSLKTMLQRLTPQSQQAQDMMTKLGFSAYDSSGKFVGLTALAGRLQKSFGGLTPEARNAAMGVIFGSDAVRAATVVYGLGADGVKKYVSEVNDTGAAARMASVQTDNLSGDMERLRGSIEVALIQGGTSATGALRDMVQWVNAVVNAYANLPPGLQKAVTLFAGVGGGAGLVAASLIILLPRIAETRTALAALGLTSVRARSAMLTVGKTGAVVAGLVALGYAAKELQSIMSGAAPSANELTSSVVDLGQTGKVSGALAKKYGVDLGGLTDAINTLSSSGANNKAVQALDKLSSGFGLFGEGDLDQAKGNIKGFDESLANLVASGNADVAAAAFKQLTDVEKTHGKSVADVTKLMPQYQDALAGVTTESKLTASGQKTLGDQAETTASDLQDTRSEAEKLTDALDALNGVNIDAAEAAIDFRQSLADMRKAIKDNGTTLDITTEKGRNVKKAFLDTAQSLAKNAEAVAKQKNSQDAGNKALADGIALLKQQMKAAGFSTDAINKLIATYIQVPSQVTTKVAVQTQSAVDDLTALQAKLARTKGRSVTVKALTADAVKGLRNLGFTVKTLPNHSVKVTVPTSGPKAAISAIRAYLATLQDKTITLTTERRVINTGKGGRGPNAQANGSVLSFFAGGGMSENHVAQIAPAGSWRVWAEDETGGESYIPLAPAKWGRSRRIAEETVRRLGGKGIAWNANGGVQRYASGGFSYTPTASATLGGTGDPMARYDAANDKLKAAWASLTKTLADAAKKTSALHDAEANLNRVRGGKHTENQLAAAEKKLSDARKASAAAGRAVNSAKQGVYSADAALGVARGSRNPGFSLSAYQKQLSLSVASTDAWRANLTRIGARGGAEVQSILEGMGEDGYALVKSLAKASDRQFADITKKLLATAGVAKATLADFNNQVNASTKVNAQFAADLQKLAGEGYGDLAQALAAQGDGAAQSLAHQAAGSAKAAAGANKAVGANQAVPTGDDLANSLVLLSTLRAKPGQGFAALASAGLDAATVRALVPKIMKQIGGLPTQYRTELLKELGGQGGSVAMARGGILTRPTTVLAGEAGDTESWIPWNGTARSASLLAKTAAGLGYRLVPAGRFVGSSTPGAGPVHVDRSQHVHLDGADRSLGEQRADLLRHMTAYA